MQIYLFLATGFEEIEAITPIDIFRRAGIELTTVSISSQKEVVGAHGVTVLADKVFDEIQFETNALLFLPGGMPGTTNLDLHAGLKLLIEKHYAANRPIAAICAAPSVLGKMGLLKGKSATCYPGFEDLLLGASIEDKAYVHSDHVLTSKGPGTAAQFSFYIVEILKGKEIAEALRVGMQF